jgi:uncharacterized protein (TIGR02246 family)
MEGSHMRTKVTLAVLLAVFAASLRNAHAQTPDADRKAIRAAWEGWLKVAAAGDADAYMTYLTDDAVIADMKQGEAPVVGRKAIHPWVKDFFAKLRFAWTEQSQDIVVTGDVALRRYTGTATFTPKEGGASSAYERRYVDVLRRGADGRWRVSHHIFTANR